MITIGVTSQHNALSQENHPGQPLSRSERSSGPRHARRTPAVIAVFGLAGAWASFDDPGARDFVPPTGAPYSTPVCRCRSATSWITGSRLCRAAGTCARPDLMGRKLLLAG